MIILVRFMFCMVQFYKQNHQQREVSVSAMLLPSLLLAPNILPMTAEQKSSHNAVMDEQGMVQYSCV